MKFKCSYFAYKMKNHFRTIVQSNAANFSLSHKDSFLLMGSCFSENIGSKLHKLKFNTLTNPLGICYNPVSIHQLLQSKKTIDLLEKEGIFFSHDLHSALNAQSKVEAEEKYKRQKSLLNKHLSQKGVLIITYGTAWVHELKETGKIVNNCQKQPSALFNKRLLSKEEIVQSFNRLKNSLSTEIEQQQIIFTVSPVRHVKDGFHENQLSKSVLHLAIDQICKESTNCSYFSSYEIMIDDLRDYRFYEDDLLHPNQQAVNYIWQKFSETYFTEATQKVNEKVNGINHSLQHKAFFPKSEQHQKFLRKLIQQMEETGEKHSLDFSEEISRLKEQVV